MRERFLIAICLLVCWAAAAAQTKGPQTKIETKWHCPGATTVHKLDVGDAPDHIYMIQQGGCSAEASKTGEKSGAFTEFHDGWKETFSFRGHFNATMEDGDMVFYTYDGSFDPKKPLSNKWKIAGGTGKYKAAKGMGSCTGKANDDHSFDWKCNGTIAVGAKAMAAKEKS